MPVSSLFYRKLRFTVSYFVSMALPPFAPFPPVNLRKEVLPEEWEHCLDSWILLAHRNLLLPPEEFSVTVSKDQSLVGFLISYVRETTASSYERAMVSPRMKALRRDCFLLTHRILSEVKPIPSALIEWTYWADLSTLYAKCTILKSLFKLIWDQENLDDSLSMQRSKTSLVQLLEAHNQLSHIPPSELDETLRRTGALLKMCYQYGQFLMLGTDLIDSLSATYQKVSTDVQRKVIVITYLSTISLIEPDRPKISTLLDQLYNLNSSSNSDSLLVGLCSRTPFLQKMRDRLSGPEAERAKPLMQKLSIFECSKDQSRRPKKFISRKINEGKGKARDEYGHGALGDIHVHRMSLVTQIQDLFPDLGSGFIVKLLDEYHDDTERVIAHLLEDSLPSHLRNIDRTEQVSHPTTVNSLKPIANRAARSTHPLPPVRRNIFDNDAFDRLAISPSSIHPGHKDPSQTADAILSTKSSRPSKTAILSALAAFDSDDDERDDTYDIGDVGGTVDSAMPGSDEVDADLSDNNEEALFSAWRMSPEVFNRDANTRRGKARAALKSATAITDEAIEGWAVMIGRDPRRLRRLEAKFASFSGAQRELAPTAYRGSAGGSATEDSDGLGVGDRGGRDGRGGSRGRGSGRIRGDVAGATDDRSTQVARHSKDAHKGSRANHNRRDQRARKMARGGFAG